MLLQIVSVFILMVSSAVCAPGAEMHGTKQVERKDKPMSDSRSALNLLRDENLGRVVDSNRNESESPFQNFIHKLALLVALFSQSSNNQNSTQTAQSSKTQSDTRGTVDPLGGGNLVRLIDSYRSEETIWDSFNSFINKLAILSVLYSQHGNSQNSTQPQPIRRNRTEPDTRGTLDSLGGGNFVRLVDSYRSEESIWDSFNNFIKKLAILSVLISTNSNHQNNTQPEPVRRNKTQPDTRGTLDSIGGGNLLRFVDSYRSEQNGRSMGGARQNMMRLARDDKSQKAAIVDRLGTGRIVDPYRSEQIFRSLDRVHFLDSLDNYQGGEVLRMLDAITGGDLLSSLDSSEATVFLNALRNTHTKHPKRMLDSMSGWSFGESKRNFDEIDNVGFTGFAKKNILSSPRRGQYLSLAKKNFDEIDRAGFETYNKRNFDEIDRTGFETFEKRDRKD